MPDHALVPREAHLPYAVVIHGEVVARFRDYDIACVFAEEIGGEVDA